MNERLLAMALECNLLDSRDDLDHPVFAEIIVSVEKFAELVAAAEREQCALVCDVAYYQNIGPAFGEVRYGITACSTAIRARSQS